MQQLAGALGRQRCEQELLPQVLVLANHKAMQRRAVAAHACGVLASYIAPRHCDSILAQLTMVRLRRGCPRTARGVTSRVWHGVCVRVSV